MDVTTRFLKDEDVMLPKRQDRSPYNWAEMIASSQVKSATLALINQQIAKNQNHSNDMNASAGKRTSVVQHILPNPILHRNRLATSHGSHSEESDYVEPRNNVLGTGFGMAAADFWPVPLVNESEIVDLDATVSNGLLPRGIDYRSGPTTEMVGRHWGLTPVTLRRMIGNEPSDLLQEELAKMRRLRHSGLLLLMGVTSSLDCESVRGLIYEPIYRGSLYYQIHIVGKPIPPPKKIVLLKQICEALIFLHSKKMLHCSISSHAVHLVSTSQAKLGCFETFTEINPLNPNTSRMYHKVPPKHRDWIIRWMSPEATRGESLCSLTDVYSFCCLVWETFNEATPWCDLDATEIEEMWNRPVAMKGSGRTLDSMLSLDSLSVPFHVKRFLKLGLQPESKDRQEIDLQEIFLMLRIQAAAIQQSQQKMESDSHKSSSVKTITKSTQTYSAQSHRPPPPPPSRIIHALPKVGSNQVEKSSIQQLPDDELLSVRQLRTRFEAKGKATIPQKLDSSRPNEVQSRQSPVLAIKPASHWIEVGLNELNFSVPSSQGSRQLWVRRHSF